MGAVFIVSATRTPIGELGGSLKEVSATSLGMGIMESCTSRIKHEKKVVDQIIMGNVFEFVNGNVARIAAVKCGFRACYTLCGGWNGFCDGDRARVALSNTEFV